MLEASRSCEDRVDPLLGVDPTRVTEDREVFGQPKLLTHGFATALDDRLS